MDSWPHGEAANGETDFAKNFKKMLSKIYGTALKPGVETINYE